MVDKIKKVEEVKKPTKVEKPKKDGLYLSTNPDGDESNKN